MQQQNRDIPTAIECFDRLPDSAIIRLPVLKAVMGISAGTIWRLSRRGDLKPVKLSERATGWRLGEVRAYLASRSRGIEAAA